LLREKLISWNNMHLVTCIIEWCKILLIRNVALHQPFTVFFCSEPVRHILKDASDFDFEGRTKLRYWSGYEFLSVTVKTLTSIELSERLNKTTGIIKTVFLSGFLLLMVFLRCLHTPRAKPDPRSHFIQLADPIHPSVKTFCRLWKNAGFTKKLIDLVECNISPNNHFA